MIYPLSLEPNDVNSTLIRIADQHNADIDTMTANINSMKKTEEELRDRYASQATRWENYQEAYKDTLNAFYAQMGTLNEQQMLGLFDWSTL